MKRAGRHLALASSFAAVCLLGGASCSDTVTTEVRGYEVDGDLYCVTAGSSGVVASRIDDGGECGAAFAESKDSYRYSGDGFTASVKQLRKTSDFAPHLASFAFHEPGPLFIIVAQHKNQEDPLMISDDFTEITGDPLGFLGDWSLSVWMIAAPEIADDAQIKAATATTRIEFGPIGAGFVSGFSIMDEYYSARSMQEYSDLSP